MTKYEVLTESGVIFTIYAYSKEQACDIVRDWHKQIPQATSIVQG